MSEKAVYVVQCLELGWDSVVAVYDTDKVDLSELEEKYPYEDKYVITERYIRTEIEE